MYSFSCFSLVSFTPLAYLSMYPSFAFRIVFGGQVRWLLSREESGPNGGRKCEEAGRSASRRAYRRSGLPRRCCIQRGDRFPGPFSVREETVHPADYQVRASAYVNTSASGAGGGSVVGVCRQRATWRQDPREWHRRGERGERGGQSLAMGPRRRDEIGPRGRSLRPAYDGGYPRRRWRRRVLLRRRQ